MGGVQQRQIFFDKQVWMKEWKDSWKTTHEDMVVDLLKSSGFEEDVDFKRQYPIEDMYIADIAFPNDRLIVEVDGNSHNSKKQKALDFKRDIYCCDKGWAILRVEHKRLEERPFLYIMIIKSYIESVRHEINDSL